MVALSWGDQTYGLRFNVDLTTKTDVIFSDEYVRKDLTFVVIGYMICDKG